MIEGSVASAATSLQSFIRVTFIRVTHTHEPASSVAALCSWTLTPPGEEHLLSQDRIDALRRREYI